MMRKIMLYALGTAALLAAVATMAYLRSAETPTTAEHFASSPCRNFNQAALRVGQEELPVAVATTAVERARGLSGCAEVPVGSGMYFTFEQPLEAQFWMKDMLTPIDIIWIRDGQVIGIDRNVPPPAVGTHDNDLPLYPAPGLVDAVLELRAGDAERLQISTGTPVVAP